MISISPGLTILLKPHRRSFYILRRGQTSPKQKQREPKRAERKRAPAVVSRKDLCSQLNVATNSLVRKGPQLRRSARKPEEKRMAELRVAEKAMSLQVEHSNGPLVIGRH